MHQRQLLIPTAVLSLCPAEGLSTVERAPLTCPQTPAWISETWSRLWRAGAQPAGYRNPLRISPAEKYGENNILGKNKLFFKKQTCRTGQSHTKLEVDLIQM